MMAGLLGSVYAFGVLTSGTDCMQKLSFSKGKLEQWSYGARAREVRRGHWA